MVLSASVLLASDSLLGQTASLVHPVLFVKDFDACEALFTATKALSIVPELARAPNINIRPCQCQHNAQ